MGGMTLIDPGSVNIGLTSDGAVPDDAAPGPYQNSYADVVHMFARTAELSAAPSISIFEPGFLRTALTWHRAGRVPPGAIVKLYFGGALEFGLPPTAAALDAYLELLEPSGLPWSVAVLAGDVVACGLAERAIRRGGHVRVGLEDWAGPGEKSNSELVRAAVALLERLGRTPATIAQTREFRDAVEAATDASQADLVAAVGADLDAVVAQLDTWSQACIDGGAFPIDPRKRAAG
jgi:uncharacterized protein (DUF849 family)